MNDNRTQSNPMDNPQSKEGFLVQHRRGFLYMCVCSHPTRHCSAIPLSPLHAAAFTNPHCRTERDGPCILIREGERQRDSERERKTETEEQRERDKEQEMKKKKHLSPSLHHSSFSPLQ